MLHYRNNVLHFSKTNLLQLVEEFGSPLYIYSAEEILDRVHVLAHSIGAENVHFAVKSNNSSAILQLIHKQGISFDVVSGGELQKLLSLGVEGKKIIFSGVGKSKAEILLAIQSGCRAIHIESTAELEMIDDIASQHQTVARVGLRVNPNTTIQAHHHIQTGHSESKFGIHMDVLPFVRAQLQEKKHLQLVGLACHIGSSIDVANPLIEAAQKLAGIAEREFCDFPLEYLDFGGGFSIAYAEGITFDPTETLRTYKELASKLNLQAIIEPGRWIVGNAGVLVTQCILTKKQGAKQYLVVDAAMNDNIRPSLYGAKLKVLCLREDLEGNRVVVDVVGPVCESGDFLAKNVELPVRKGEFYAVLGSGAYTSSMASTYNIRPLLPEVLVFSDGYRLIRTRQTIEQIWQNDILLPK